MTQPEYRMEFDSVRMCSKSKFTILADNAPLNIKILKFSENFLKVLKFSKKKIEFFWNFEIDQEMDAILLIIGIVYEVCRIVIKSVQQCTYFLFSVNLHLFGVHLSPQCAYIS
jgi:hypothetical protein